MDITQEKDPAIDREEFERRLKTIFKIEIANDFSHAMLLKNQEMLDTLQDVCIEKQACIDMLLKEWDEADDKAKIVAKVSKSLKPKSTPTPSRIRL